jgi:hypothetical protein
MFGDGLPVSNGAWDNECNGAMTCNSQRFLVARPERLRRIALYKSGAEA